VPKVFYEQKGAKRLNCLHLVQGKSITLKDVSSLMNTSWLAGKENYKESKGGKVVVTLV